MQCLYLLKYGELSLKGKNRESFEKRLCNNIRNKLQDIDLELIRGKGRLYLRSEETNTSLIQRALATTFGLVAYARAVKVEKRLPRIEAAAFDLVEGILATRGHRFKIEARRTDKSFPLNSYQIACHLGDSLCSRFPELIVDLTRPDWILNVEIREAAYLYGPEFRGPGGLPLGSSGKGLLLLSGGIDSPVAGYLMGKRGLKIEAIYFHTPPFTSEQALEKVGRLTQRLAHFLTGIKLQVIPFSQIQMRIKEDAKAEEMTLLMRYCMMRIGDRLARQRGSVGLITGESLGQVASQTPESIRFTDSGSQLPVFRPLIGFDKEEIVALARRIETYEISILPYEDCCTIFNAPYPLVKPEYQRMIASFQRLALGELLDEAARRAYTWHPAPQLAL